jgi:hypothetical protein
MTYFLDSFPVGATKLIAPIEQPKMNGCWTEVSDSGTGVWFHNETSLGYYHVFCLFPYPIGARIGVSEPINPSICEDMPNNDTSDIRYLTVTAVAVKQVKELTDEEIQDAGYKYLNRMPVIFPPDTPIKNLHELAAVIAQGVLLESHPDWTPDTWVEVATVKEEK